MALNITDPKAALDAILAAIDGGADHFGVLQLPPSASLSDIRDAYFKLAKVVHPDLPLFISNSKLRVEATRAFQAITLAHSTLSDPAKRLLYTSAMENAKQQRIVDAMTAPVSTRISGSGQVTAETGRIYYARGKTAAQRRDWQVAQDALGISLKHMEGAELIDAQLQLGWAMLNNPQAAEIDRVTRSKELFFGVLSAAPKSAAAASAHYYLGVWNKFHGDMREAGRHFDGCLAVDPRHIEAKREKMILERRRGPEPAKGKPLSTASPSKTGTAAAPSGSHAAQRVGLEKKPSFLERIFGKKD